MTMQLPELLHALRHLGLGGMATSLEARLVQAQADHSAYADFLALLLQDELTRRADRLLTRRLKEAQLRDPDKTLDGFDFAFNKKMDRHLVFELATGRFLTQREDVVFLGPPGTGKSHLAQALGHALIQQGHRVLYREAHRLLEDLPAPPTGARRARYSRLPATRHLTLRTDACGLFPPRCSHHPPPLAVGGPHAVVPNLVSTPRPCWPVLTRRRMAGFEVSIEGI